MKSDPRSAVVFSPFSRQHALDKEVCADEQVADPSLNDCVKKVCTLLQVDGLPLNITSTSTEINIDLNETSITQVGALNGGSISAGFGNINAGSITAGAITALQASIGSGLGELLAAVSQLCADTEADVIDEVEGIYGREYNAANGGVGIIFNIAVNSSLKSQIKQALLKLKQG